MPAQHEGYANFLEYLTGKHLQLEGYSVKDFLYGHNGPCPQVARDHPFGQAPQILDIPKEEWDDWKEYVQSYYLREMATLWFDARTWRRERWKESGGHGYRKVDDAEFTQLVSEGLYSKFLCPALDPHTDQERFKKLMTAGAEYWKSDYSCMALIDELRDPEMYVAPTVVLLERKGPQAFVVVAIDLSYWDDAAKDYVAIPEPLTPADGDAWELAKYYVLQGAIHRINLIDHTKVHFPGDVINAITKTALPVSNIVHQLLLPHFWLTLPVNHAVLEGEKSIINRDSWYAWSPFAAVKAEIRRLLALAWYGSRYYWKEENSAYPPYRFESKPPEIPSKYGEFLGACYGPIRKFVRVVVETLPADGDSREWIEVQSWAAQISGWLPGFPEWPTFSFHDAATRTAALDALADVLATVIHNASVIHSADHATLHWMIAQAPVPYILRVPPPRSATDPIVMPAGLVNSFREMIEFSFATLGVELPAHHTEKDPHPLQSGAAILCHPEDLDATRWADLLFYRPHNTDLLIESKYDFKQHTASLQQAVTHFRNDLANVPVPTTAGLPKISPPPGTNSKEREREYVASGIQY